MLLLVAAAVVCRAGAGPVTGEAGEDTEGVAAVCTPGENSVQCGCEKYQLLWTDGRCYREFTRGPCPLGHRSVSSGQG